MASFITRQPFKTPFILLSRLFTAIRIPFWIIYFIPPFLRQHPAWSYRQALGVRILSAALNAMSLSEDGTPTPLHGDESKGFVVIQTARESAYTGVVSKDEETRPEQIGGTWHPKTLEKYNGEDILFHIHGGAFVIGDGRGLKIGDSAFTAQTLLNHTKVSYAFFPQYRLSSNGSRFPAALQDVITSYCYLTETLSIPAKKITISGDSAGANIALAFLRYLADHPQTNIPSPVCAWLWSLWVDPGIVLRTDLPPLVSPNAFTDYLNITFAAWGARTYSPRPETGMTMAHPYIRFSGAAFATPTPLFFAAGEAETQYAEIAESYKEFKNVPGNKVEFQSEKNAVHDIILLGDVAGFQKEAAVAAKAADKFLEGCE